jgi:hypothetical protein
MNVFDGGFEDVDVALRTQDGLQRFGVGVAVALGG